MPESKEEEQRLTIGIDGRWMSDDYPGIGRYVYNLLASLPKVATAETFVVPVAPAAGPARFDLSELGGCDLRPILAAARSPKGQLAIRHLELDASLDLFHATYFPGALGVRCPKVVTIFDVIPIQFPESIPDRSRGLLYRLGLRQVLRSAIRILTPTQVIRHQLIELFGIPPHRIVATPWPPEPKFAPVAQETLTSFRRRLELPDRYLLYLGTNKPHKNLRRLVEAWTIASREGNDGYQLVFAGPVDERFPRPDRLVEEMRARQTIILGKVEEKDLPALVGGAAALLQPSLWEGLGLPVLEAMGCGTPVACSAIPSLAETASNAALTFDPTDVESIAEAIVRLIGDSELRVELGRRGRERVRLYSWREAAERTLETYREAIFAP